MSQQQNENLPPIEKLVDLGKDNGPEKEKPKAKIIESDGKIARKKRAVDMNISEQLLPPITRGRTAVYKLVNSWDNNLPDWEQGKIKVIDPSTGHKPDPRDLVLPGMYIWYDTFEDDLTKRNKTMFNYGAEKLDENLKGENFLSKELQDIEFIADFKSVDPIRNYPEYAFMELHPLNGSNKHRPNKNKTRPLFMRVDFTLNKSNHFKIIENELAFDAENAVRSIIKKDKIIALVASIRDLAHSVNDSPIDELKYNLRIWARNNPRDFFKLHGDVTPAIKLSVVNAQNLGLIEYRGDTNEWFNLELDEPFVKVAIGEDPLERITSVLKTDEYKYKIVTDLLDYWE